MLSMEHLSCLLGSFTLSRVACKHCLNTLECCCSALMLRWVCLAGVPILIVEGTVCLFSMRAFVYGDAWPQALGQVMLTQLKTGGACCRRRR